MGIGAIEAAAIYQGVEVLQLFINQCGSTSVSWLNVGPGCRHYFTDEDIVA